MCYSGTCVWSSLTAGVCVECDKSMICILCVNRARWDTYIMHLLCERSKWCTLHCIPWHSSHVINLYLSQKVLVLAQGSLMIQREREKTKKKETFYQWPKLSCCNGWYHVYISSLNGGTTVSQNTLWLHGNKSFIHVKYCVALKKRAK